MSSTWQVFRYFSKGTPAGVGDYIRNGWGDDISDLVSADYSTVCLLPGVDSSVAGLFAGGVKIYDEETGFSNYIYSNITSSPNYLFFLRRIGSVLPDTPVAGSLQAVRIEIATGDTEYINIFPSWTPPSDIGTKQFWSAISVYSDTVGYAVVSTTYSNAPISKYLVKLNFSTPSCTTVYTFPAGSEERGMPTTCLSLWEISTGSKLLLSYPNLIYYYDAGEGTFYVRSINWLIFDPASDTEIATVSHSYDDYDINATSLDDDSFMSDGNNELSNPVVIGDKLVSFIGTWSGPNVMEIHCVDLNAGTLTITRIDRGNQNTVFHYGSQIDVASQKAYCVIWYYDSSWDTYTELLCYEPALGALTNTVLGVNWDANLPSHAGTLADAQYAYYLEPVDASSEELHKCSDFSLVSSIFRESQGCSVVDKIKNGVVECEGTGNNGVVYYSDGTNDAFSTDAYASGWIFLHTTRLFIVALVTSTTPNRFRIYYFPPS